MNLIKDRDARTKKRQIAKEKYDKQITLAMLNERDKRYCFSAERSEGSARLLDEGAIVTANGELDLYIKKGTISKFFDGKNEHLKNLSNRYEGTINIGHQDFATFPFIVGSWKKSDLTVVDEDDGRQGLDVDLKLNEAHPLVQALRVQGIPVGVSVEMYLHFNEEDTLAETEMRKEYTPVVDEIFIADFAIVGECGNVGSSESVDLQGVKMDELIKDTDLEEVPVEEDVEDISATEEEETEEVVAEETVEDETSDAEEEEPVENEGVEEEISEEAESEEAEDEEDALAVAMETIETLRAENEALKAQIEALKKSNNKKEKKIKEYAEKNADAAKKFKNLSVSLGLTKEVKREVTHKRYATGDGIGE